ncbi:DUF1150 family protein [Falsirhodobacter deserti]|uniref:DUF1150 family protein n=1 Tax=Falsirhodobacter deserti TaxID=1365611 RepID=UPI000FE2DE2D|nr:DUF1150 family protein [Falsirhodobacter deserti]
MNISETPNDRLVYVRPVAVADLPQDVQDQAEGLETLYALHSADGEQLALVRNRNMAFQLALQNDLAPVNVH